MPRKRNVGRPCFRPDSADREHKVFRNRFDDSIGGGVPATCKHYDLPLAVSKTSNFNTINY
jgi:hypothetical protein